MRGKQAAKRKIKADPKFGRLDVSKLVNYVMRRGKKTTAQKVVYRALEIMEEEGKRNPFEIFERAMKNVGPTLEVRGRRIGGANYQIPFPVSDERRLILSYRWILGAAKARKGQPMAKALAMELIDAAKNEGAAIKKKEDTQRMAEANKAFAHFARFTKKRK